MIVAILGVFDVQVTDAVISRVVPSEYVAVAAMFSVWPIVIDWFAGVTLIETSVPFVTVTKVDASPSWYLQSILVVPTETPVATPVDEIVAISGCVEVHVAPGVTSIVRPSARVPVAVKFVVSPTWILGFVGERVIWVTVLSEMKKEPHETSNRAQTTAAERALRRTAVIFIRIF